MEILVPSDPIYQRFLHYYYMAILHAANTVDSLSEVAPQVTRANVPMI